MRHLSAFWPSTSRPCKLTGTSPDDGKNCDRFNRRQARRSASGLPSEASARATQYAARSRCSPHASPRPRLNPSLRRLHALPRPTSTRSSARRSTRPSGGPRRRPGLTSTRSSTRRSGGAAASRATASGRPRSRRTCHAPSRFCGASEAASPSDRVQFPFGGGGACRRAAIYLWGFAADQFHSRVGFAVRLEEQNSALNS